MKLFTDQDVYQTTIDYLKSPGYNVLKASDVGLQRAPDEELLRYASEHQRILVTRDKGYGALVFLSFQKP
jgi:predicted nuclease of predicted toxin-antitoxin system